MYRVGKKSEKKVTHGPNSPRPALLQPASQVGWAEIFLRVENINPPPKKLQVMRVNPADPTRFTISSTLVEEEE